MKLVNLKAQMELSQSRYIKGNVEGFYKYIIIKGRSREDVDKVLNGTGSVVSQNDEKAQVLNAFFTCKTDLEESQVPNAKVEGWNGKGVFRGEGSGQKIFQQADHLQVIK